MALDLAVLVEIPAISGTLPMVVGSTEYTGTGFLRRRGMMIELTRKIVHTLVDNPEKVVVTAVRGDQTTILKISTGPGEAGKVIGKQGRIADALRTLLTAAAAREKRRVIVEIAGNQGHFPKKDRLPPIIRRPARGFGQQAAL
jgi:uncharacterized protein